jgi:cell division protein FtsQ
VTGTGTPTPGPSDHVPDHVLSELLAAFEHESPAEPSYDFDDPSIDRLLGLDPHELTHAHAVIPGGEVDPPEFGDDPTEAAPPPAKHTTGEHDALVEGGTDEPVETPPTDPEASTGSVLAPAAEGPRRAAEPVAELAAEPAAEPGAELAAEPVAERRVILIADDDRADAVYLGEDAENRLRATHPGTNAAAGEETGERSTIVISEYADQIDTQPARTASSIDPRLRARRVAVRRAAGRKRLVWAGIVAAIVIVVTGLIALLASSIFDVTRVDVQGNAYTDPTLVAEVSKSLMGKPILLVDTKAAERRLEADPWVDSARVSTDFPHRVLIDIRERRPLGTFAGSDGKFRVIDRDGRVLAVLDSRPTAYMLITGTAPDTDAGQFAGPSYAAVAQLVLALPPEIRQITTSVGVDATTGNLTLALDGSAAPGVEVNLGSGTGMQDKLARLLQKVRDGLNANQRLDVSTGEVGS